MDGTCHIIINVLCTNPYNKCPRSRRTSFAKMDNKGSQLEIALHEDEDWNFKIA